MSVNITGCTPPFTPPQSQNEEDFPFDSFDFNEAIINAEAKIIIEDKIRKYCSFRWFNCLGDTRLDASSNEDSFLSKGEEDFLEDEFSEIATSFEDHEMEKIELFGLTLDKGASLLLDKDVLYKKSLCNLMAVLYELSTSTPHPQPLDACETRKQLIHFFLHIRSYILHLVSSQTDETDLILKNITRKLSQILQRIQRVLRKFVDVQKFTIFQTSHHWFHCNWELRWLHVTTLFVLYKSNEIVKKRGGNTADPLQYQGEIGDINITTILNSMELLVSDLVQLSVMRFEKLGAKSVSKYSAFQCSCIEELWISVKTLLSSLEKLSCDISDDNNESQYSFWRIVSSALARICDKTNPSANVIKTVSVFETDLADIFYDCSSPNLFKLWFVKSVATGFSDRNRELSGNYVILEKILKDELKDECCETNLRLLVSLLHVLVVEVWQPRNDAILVLWEYFQKRLSRSFYVTGETLGNMSVIPKTSDKFLAQISGRLDDRDEKFNSFHLFLRLLGHHLRRTCGEKRFWNQLKGRIYSKFPASKMIALTELGVYNFVSLFLTIAVVKLDEVGEICKNLQDFLDLTNKKDSSIRSLVFLTHVTILDMLARNGIEFSMCAANFVKFLKSLDLRSPENIRLTSCGIDSLRTVFVSDKIDLGLPKIVDDWVCDYLLFTSNSTDTAKLTLYIDSLLVEMKSIRIYSPQHVETFEVLWTQIKKLITNPKFNPKNSEFLGSLCANLAIVSTKIYRSATMLREVSNLVANSKTLPVGTLSEFLNTLIGYKPLPMALRDHDVFILKLWIRYEVLSGSSSTSNKILNYVTSLSECQNLNLNLDPQEPLISFCKSLHQRYLSIIDTDEKKSMFEKTTRYFGNLKEWIDPVVKTADDVSLLKRVYFTVGSIVDTAGVFLYDKGAQFGSILQGVMDLLLLTPPSRRPGFKLQTNLQSAVSESFYLFVEGLVKIRKDGDQIFSKMIQDLIIIYLPQCVHLNDSRKFSLVKSFRPSLGDKREIVMKTILETIRIHFIKPRARVPSQECRQMIKRPCLPAGFESTTSEEVMQMLSELCRVHLAFSARQVFGLFQVLAASSAADLVYRFMPNLTKAISQVEAQRGSGYDRALRGELANLAKAINYKY
ncbi:protein MMS22-like [Nilaparvata lugens]|uniref:protein MMS22-like n=1 Tax=Nilaparvata lugens TaxID=108931 RepID=UPI00193CBF5F|nr:protein MMS22-like [Nilaparvata lugens]